YAAAYPFGYCALRYFNAAGASPAGDIGEDHEPETHLIPLVFQAATGKRPHVEVFGTDYPTPDGTCVRDYIHVNDLAEAHVLALEQVTKENETLALNLGTGQGYSVMEVINTVERITGRAVPRSIAPRRAGDPPALVADSKRAQQVLGWRPRRSLQEIVSTAWK